MHSQSLAQQVLSLAKGDYSSVELTEHYLARIDKHNNLNAYLSTNADSALEQAQQADKRRKHGEYGPLTGIPISLKDLISVQGSKTTCGSKMLANYTSPYTATLAQKLFDAGCVLLGKTNLDEFAMGSSTESSFFGATLNPWDTTRTPGGSSGGSAAAVAARLCSASIGTDTGGSIRQPAAFTGTTGIKPTYGRVSRYGVVAYASSLDQAGPMTQTAEDSALVLQAISGHDPKDSTSLPHQVDNYQGALNQPLQGLKIGLAKEYLPDTLPAEIQQVIEKTVQALEKLGAEIVSLSLPHTEVAIDAYYVIAPAECSSNLSRFDGVRFGHRCEDPKNLEDLYCRSRAEGFGDEVKRRILTGAYVLSAGYYDAYYRKAQQIRRLVSQDFQQAFSTVDAILCPTTPSTAFTLGQQDSHPTHQYLADVFTIATNLAGLPALSFPAGQSEGLPIGVQLIGKHLDEATLLRIAHQFQLSSDWHTKIPADFA